MATTTVTATTNSNHNEMSMERGTSSNNNKINGTSNNNNEDEDILTGTGTATTASIKLAIEGENLQAVAANDSEELRLAGAMLRKSQGQMSDVNELRRQQRLNDVLNEDVLTDDEDDLADYAATAAFGDWQAGGEGEQDNDPNLYDDFILDEEQFKEQPQQQQQQSQFTTQNVNLYNANEALADGNQHQLQVPSNLMEPSSPASVCYSDDSIPEMKYTPNEYLMQPPPAAGLMYNYPPMPQHPSVAAVAGGPPPQMGRHYGYQQQHMPHPPPPPPPPHHPHHRHHPAYGGMPPSAQRYHHLPPHHHGNRVLPLQYAQHSAASSSGGGGGYYPNMWYPNAPYGSSSRFHQQYAGGGGGGYPHHHPQAQHPHHHPHHHGQHYGYPHDPMLEMLQLSNSGREARNRAEKNRRDKLNGSIQELSTMVPHVAESPKRVDKTAVLRFAAHGLRLNYIFGNSMHMNRPELTDSLMKLLNSFFLTLTCHGQIVLISNSIEQHLGHCQADLYGQNILQITHPEDHALLKQQLIPTDLENLFDVHPDDENGEPRPRTKAEEQYIDKCLLEDKRSFTVRLARAGPRSEPTAYEIVKIDGCFRRSDAAPRGIKSSTFISSLQLIRRTRGRDDTIPLHTISGNDIVLVAVARIIGPPKIINRPMESTFLEYKTRHLIDGRIIDCDQRISIVAGYMRDEVQNLSPFTFIHQDDVRWVIVALRQMYDCNSSYGESTYRLYTRNRNFIYLQTKGYLEIDKDTNKVHSFVCINTLLDEEEGKRRVQEMKNKFSVIIKTKIPQSSIDAPAAENPHQLEKAVMCLIQNLQKSPSDDDEEDEQQHQASATGYGYDCTDGAGGSHTALHMKRQSSRISSHRGSSKTPPLALVPPEPSSIKSTISKSLSLVNVTSTKHGYNNLEQGAGADDNMLDDFADADDGIGEAATAASGRCDCLQQGRSGDCMCVYPGEMPLRNESNLKRRTCSEREVGLMPDEESASFGKRRLKSCAEIENVLTSSLNQIEQTLNRQWNTANELRDCGNKYQIPHTNERIVEIMEEHQEQSEIYLNIKSEYEVQRQNLASTTKNESDPQLNTKELRPS